jgi:uncharacterized protein YndB with AHSA1/START domain
MNHTIERSQVHATFVIERSLPGARRGGLARTLGQRRTRPMVNAGSAFDADEKSHDFRVGGHGTEEGQWHDGPRSKFRSTYTDIVDLQRVVFTYDMWVDGRHLSTSLTTIVLEPDGDQTRLTYTEQGVHFDGLDSIEGREEGSRGLLDQLGSYLASRN